MRSRRKFINQAVAGMAGLLVTNHLEAGPQSLSAFEKTGGGTGVMPAINSGIGGNNTIDLLERLQVDCLAHQPRLTILMIGTNDMNSKKHVPLETYEQNLSKIITPIVKSGSKLLLMTILPAYEPYLFTRHEASFYDPEGVSAEESRSMMLSGKQLPGTRLAYWTWNSGSWRWAR